MSIDESPPSLDRVVTEVATRLMAADSTNNTEVYTDVLEILVDYFGVDVSFLRRNDHEIGASILVAEWPLRPEIPDPDPLRVVYFADADPAAEEYVEGSLTFDGETIPGIGVRYKGSVGAFVGCTASANPLAAEGPKTCTKLSMKLKINWTDPDAEFYGVRHVLLHSQNLDSTMMHERLAYWMFREMGVPMALATGMGAEVQKPLATVVICGIISSTLLTLVVVPVLYGWFEPRSAEREERSAEQFPDSVQPLS